MTATHNFTDLSCSLFDLDYFRDVKLKIGHEAYKCHRMILCRSSEYFTKLCGPDSQFEEGSQATIELKEDDPGAAKAVLLHLYGVSYPKILENLGIGGTGIVNMALKNVLVLHAGRKYQLQKLTSSAALTLENAISF